MFAGTQVPWIVTYISFMFALCAMGAAGAFGGNPSPWTLGAMLVCVLGNAVYQFANLTMLPKRILRDYLAKHPLATESGPVGSMDDALFCGFNGVLARLTDGFRGLNVFNVFVKDQDGIKEEWVGHAKGNEASFAGKFEKATVRTLKVFFDRWCDPHNARKKQKYIFATGVWYVGGIDLAFQLFGAKRLPPGLRAAATAFGVGYFVFLVGVLVAAFGVVLADLSWL